MPSQESNNKRIAKNTMFMYFRMFIIMAISLYTSRIVLQTLGVKDYGLYNVIGGVIAMFSFLNGAMANTTSRYITFYLGRNDEKMLANIFSMSFIIHSAIAIIVVILGETIGLWFVYEKLVVPEGRFPAALLLYQFSIISTVISILYIPSNAAIIAHEKMSAFAYISIIDAFLKLLIVFLLIWAPCDKLVFYGSLVSLVQVVDMSIYIFYGRIHFVETRLRWFWDINVFKEMFGFAGWSLLGNFSYIFFTQGINLILNSFFGTAVNAARGVAIQVEGLVKQFAINVQTAINPQIIKTYSDNNLDRMYSLIFVSSRYCFYLLFLLALPIMIEADNILSLWLGKYPEHTVAFLRLTLINVILDGMVNPMFTANLASGKVKIYQIVISIISYAFMPITYFIVKLSNIPEAAFVSLLVCTIVGIIARVFIIRIQIGMPVKLYVLKVIRPNVIVCTFSCIVPILAYKYLQNCFANFIAIILITALSVLICIYLFGTTSPEKIFIRNRTIHFLAKNYR